MGNCRIPAVCTKCITYDLLVQLGFYRKYATHSFQYGMLQGATCNNSMDSAGYFAKRQCMLQMHKSASSIPDELLIRCMATPLTEGTSQKHKAVVALSLW